MQRFWLRSDSHGKTISARPKPPPRHTSIRVPARSPPPAVSRLRPCVESLSLSVSASSRVSFVKAAIDGYILLARTSGHADSCVSARHPLCISLIRRSRKCRALGEQALSSIEQAAIRLSATYTALVPAPMPPVRSGCITLRGSRASHAGQWPKNRIDGKRVLEPRRQRRVIFFQPLAKIKCSPMAGPIERYRY